MYVFNFPLSLCVSDVIISFRTRIDRDNISSRYSCFIAHIPSNTNHNYCYFCDLSMSKEARDPKE